MKFLVKYLVKYLIIFSILFPIQSFAQQDMGKSHVAMAYVCWHLANDAGYERDSDLFAKMISMIRKLPDFKAEQHYEFMGYAAREVLKMDAIKREGIYTVGCLETLENIKRAEKQGMLN
jgi:hypothetical protein